MAQPKDGDRDTGLPSRLVAIVCTDVQSSTSRTHANQPQTLAQIHQDCQVIAAYTQQYGGRVVAKLGDGLVIVFSAVGRAWIAMLAAQAALETSPLSHRVSLHLGEVVFSQILDSQARLIAEALQKLSPPGGLCVSRSVWDTLSPRLAISLPLGDLHPMPGLTEKRRVYPIAPPLTTLAKLTQQQQENLIAAKLRAIVFTSIHDYTHKVHRDQVHIYACAQRDFALMAAQLQSSAGEVIKSLGSGLMLTFRSAQQAVSWAIAAQRALQKQAEDLPPSAVLHHRIGIHLGDIECHQTDIAGDAVNIAARLPDQAPLGGLCLSCVVHDAIVAWLPNLATQTKGQLETLKGIEHPMRVFQINLRSRPTLQTRWTHRLGRRAQVKSPETAETPAGAIQDSEPNPAAFPGSSIDPINLQAADFTKTTSPAAQAAELIAAYKQGQRDFSQQDLRDLPLANQCLAGINLSQANLTSANLARTDLSGATLSRADLTAANLKNASLARSYCNYTNFENADLQGVDLSHSHLSNANFRGANLCQANLTAARINDFQLAHAITDRTTIYPEGKKRR